MLDIFYPPKENRKNDQPCHGFYFFNVVKQMQPRYPFIIITVIVTIFLLLSRVSKIIIDGKIF